MAIIGAGKYVFGEDIPEGKYDLKAVSGQGMLIIQSEKEGGYDVDMFFGVNHSPDPDDYDECSDDYTESYKNLSLPAGKYFEIRDSVKVKITRSKMLEI